MAYENQFKKVAVLGAAGKMGSGILLLTAIEMAKIKFQQDDPDIDFILYAMDVSEEGLKGVMKYIEKQVRKNGERNPDQVKGYYNGNDQEMTEEYLLEKYVSDVIKLIKPVTLLGSLRDVDTVFEAVSEDKGLKIKLLAEIENYNPGHVWYLTNTSSIPIGELNEAAGLYGRIIGFHFYNPPAIQKLVEVIESEDTVSGLKDFAQQLIEHMGKIMVPANDIAGFIGNGHFIRDSLFGIKQAEKLSGENSFPLAVYMVNTISSRFLVRPMGIFQLIDYVGIDVVRLIMNVMNNRIKEETISSPLLDKLMELGAKGGQNTDGSQKNGFFQYDDGKITGIYDPESRSYTPVSGLKEQAYVKLGSTPSYMPVWKEIIKDPEKDKKLEDYFVELSETDSPGAKLAMEYGKNSKKIAEKLVSDKVAFSDKDVNTILKRGFFHAYGPINNYFNKL
ncbi:MAG: 3-hydroxyacyl-CoA dehydrogenase family protein [Bacteroidetes bacterium]|nr:3-hydroxyacyl-CoA dehydrogenase family protein [Bacteroidota bacterium]